MHNIKMHMFDCSSAVFITRVVFYLLKDHPSPPSISFRIRTFSITVRLLFTGPFVWGCHSPPFPHSLVSQSERESTRNEESVDWNYFLVSRFAEMEYNRALSISHTISPLRQSCARNKEVTRKLRLQFTAFVPPSAATNFSLRPQRSSRLFWTRNCQYSLMERGSRWREESTLEGEKHNVICSALLMCADWSPFEIIEITRFKYSHRTFGFRVLLRAQLGIETEKVNYVMKIDS